MNNPRFELRQVRGFADILDATFSFLRQHFKPLGKAILYILLPVALIVGVLQGYVLMQTLQIAANAGSAPDPMDSLYEFGFLNIAATVLAGFGGIIAAAVPLLYMRRYLREGAEADLSPQAIWQDMGEYFGPLLGSSILLFLLIILGFFLLVLPGFWLMGLTALVLPLVVLEDRSFGEAFSRSRQLVNDYWWFTFGLVIVLALLQYFIAAAFGIPVTVGSMFLTMLATRGEEITMLSAGLMALGSIVQFFASYAATSIFMIGMCLHYFNMVERKEGVGLIEKAEAFGTSSPME